MLVSTFHTDGERLNRAPVRICFAAMMAVGLSAGNAQVVVRPGAAVQRVGLDGPLGGQEGLGLALSTSLTTKPGFGGTLSADVARLAHGDRITPCIGRPDGGCLQRPDRETVVGFGFSLEFQVPTGQRLRPFFGAGPAVRVASGPRQVGERRTWATPQVEGGLRIATGGAQWAFSIRWRRVDRWDVVGPYGELALLFGVRRGRQF